MITLRSLMRLGRAMQLPKAALPHPLLYTPLCGMAFMQLFERNKTPAELSPTFKRETKLKGHLKSKAIKNHSKKLNTNTRVVKQKLKNHKGLLKRIKIVYLLSYRLVLAGTEGSNFRVPVPTICSATKVAPTCYASAEQDTCTLPTCVKSRNSFPITSANR